jgi:hypothetical protein
MLQLIHKKKLLTLAQSLYIKKLGVATLDKVAANSFN